jgi:hypothetical protein
MRAAHAGITPVFEAGERVAVLLGQKLIGRKKWERRETGTFRAGRTC